MKSTRTPKAQRLAGQVARWWLPERWAFLAEVPKTSVGKFDKRALRTLYREGRIAVQRVEDRPAQPQAEEGATP